MKNISCLAQMKTEHRLLGGLKGEETLRALWLVFRGEDLLSVGGEQTKVKKTKQKQIAGVLEIRFSTLPIAHHISSLLKCIFTSLKLVELKRTIQN